MPKIILKENVECFRLIDLLKEEASRFSGFVYCNQPYTCGLDECFIHLAEAHVPIENIDRIERRELGTSIFIRSTNKRKRKLLEVKLFVW